MSNTSFSQFIASLAITCLMMRAFGCLFIYLVFGKKAFEPVDREETSISSSVTSAGSSHKHVATAGSVSIFAPSDAVNTKPINFAPEESRFVIVGKISNLYLDAEQINTPFHDGYETQQQQPKEVEATPSLVESDDEESVIEEATPVVEEDRFVLVGLISNLYLDAEQINTPFHAGYNNIQQPPSEVSVPLVTIRSAPAILVETVESDDEDDNTVETEFTPVELFPSSVGSPIVANPIPTLIIPQQSKAAAVSVPLVAAPTVLVGTVELDDDNVEDDVSVVSFDSQEMNAIDVFGVEDDDDASFASFNSQDMNAVDVFALGDDEEDPFVHKSGSTQFASGSPAVAAPVAAQPAASTNASAVTNTAPQSTVPVPMVWERTFESMEWERAFESMEWELTFESMEWELTREPMEWELIREPMDVDHEFMQWVYTK